MIHGIGVDSVSLKRVEKLWDRYGMRFAVKVLHPQELQGLARRASPARYLAKGFAAREAIVKALGTGLSQGVVMRDIEIYREPGGKPGFRLYGAGLRLAEQYGIDGFHLSITDEAERVVAFALLESRTGAAGGP